MGTVRSTMPTAPRSGCPHFVVALMSWARHRSGRHRGGVPLPPVTLPGVTVEPSAPPVRLGLAAQLIRFVAIGGLSAVVDFGIYHALLAVGLVATVAKAVSFVCGTTTAYLLNRRFTFRAAGGNARLTGFVLLYGTTFAINVGTNALMLALLPPMPLRVSVAWVIAQAVATVINFVMLRTVVFRERPA